MKKLLIVILMLLGWVCNPALVHAAETFIVEGVVYERPSTSSLTCVVTGWDEETPIQSLHILGEVEGWEVAGVEAGAFQDITGIEYVTINEGVGYIGQNAFGRCTGLKCLILPEGLETIEEEAFAFCTGLTTVVIPSTVTDVQSHAFWQCTSVTDVYFLTDDVTQLTSEFEWWDGIYRDPPTEAGGMEFNTVENTTIHVPTGSLQDYIDSHKFDAWLQAMQEDDDTYPLWWIVNYGVAGREYTVDDALTAVYVDINGDLYAKDDNHWLTPDRIYDHEVDYMSQTGLMADQSNTYDQSNWVVLRGTSLPQGCYQIDGRTITGTLFDKRNPVIAVTSTTLQPGEPAQYQPNVYIAASLMGRTQVSEASGRTYAFVRPKPQEYARIEWAIYGDHDEFYVPAPDGETTNLAELKGGFVATYDLYDGFFDPDDLVINGCYPMTAIIANRLQIADNRLQTRASELTPYVDGGVTPWYDVHVLQLPESGSIVTGIASSEKQETTTVVGYYDLNGHYLGTIKPRTPGIYINQVAHPLQAPLKMGECSGAVIVHCTLCIVH